MAVLALPLSVPLSLPLLVALLVTEDCGLVGFCLVRNKLINATLRLAKRSGRRAAGMLWATRAVALFHDLRIPVVPACASRCTSTSVQAF
jgi:hypothetical protein